MRARPALTAAVIVVAVCAMAWHFASIAAEKRAMLQTNHIGETEWLSSANPDRMLVSLAESEKNSRRLSRWACACLRRIWPMLTDERCRTAVEVTEQNDDGRTTEKQFMDAFWEAIKGWGAQADEAANANYASPLHRAMPDAGLAAWHCIDGDWQCAGNAADAVANFAATEGDPAWKTARDQEAQAQADLLRDVFGNPFRRIEFASAWKTPEVIALAQSIYDEKTFERMPDLADALANAGCTVPDVLEHCRSNGPHVRGCWVVDLILGKK